MKQGEPYYNEQGKAIKVDIEFDWQSDSDDIMRLVDKALKNMALSLFTMILKAISTLFLLNQNEHHWTILSCEKGWN